MPNILDVAKRAGVSVTTVSRVMTNSSHTVNPETRERVLEAAHALNYVPNQLARALVNDETRLIGVIVGDASDPYFANIVRGVNETAQANGYLTIICNTERVPEVELGFLRLLRNYCADGIIIAGGGLSNPNHQEKVQEIVSWLQEQRVPVVALGRQVFQVAQVSIDDVRASQEMTEYLIGLGHTRIGYIAGPFTLTTSQLRLEGYQQALAQAGIPFDPDLIVETNFTYEGGRDAATRLMALHPVPSAIFGANDQVALGCLFQLKQQGIRVPEQVSLAGFDDIDMVQYVNPPLTTVQVPMHEIGVMGMKQVLQILNSGETHAEQQTLPHSLVIRASTVPPGGG